MTPANVCIREVGPEDAAACIDLDRRLAAAGDGMVITPDQVPSVAGERRRIAAQLADPGENVHLVAASDAGILASALVRQFVPALCAHVGVVTLGVRPDAQGRGLGRRILTALLERTDAGGLDRLELYVRSDNPRAIRLYEAVGFHHEGVRVGFVRLLDGTLVDDLIMARFRPHRGPGGTCRRA